MTRLMAELSQSLSMDAPEGPSTGWYALKGGQLSSSENRASGKMEAKRDEVGLVRLPLDVKHVLKVQREERLATETVRARQFKFWIYIAGASRGLRWCQPCSAPCKHVSQGSSEARSTRAQARTDARKRGDFVFCL